MREDSPRWENINPSQFAHEREGMRELASYLPDAEPFHVWANVEFVAPDGSINEVDALILTPSGLFIVELKHWQGEISGDGTQWVRRMPNGRLTPEDNPYLLANRKAKRLAGLIRHYARQQGKDAQIYVGAAIFLHAQNVSSHLDDLGRQHVYFLDGTDPKLPSMKAMLLAAPRNPAHLVDDSRAQQIVALVRGAKIRPSVADRRVGQLILHPRPFAEGIGWQDFLAGHSLDTSLIRRVRLYLTSRAPEADVPAIRRAAEREFRLLQGIHHAGIARAADLVDHRLGMAVIFEHDQSWVRFDQWLVEHSQKLRLAQRLRLVQDLAEIIDYAHSRRLAHRALHPRAIFVADPDKVQPRLVITDWQTGGRIAGSTQLTRLSSSSDGAGLDLFFDDEVRRYQAPEAVTSAKVPGIQLDVFSLGVIAYRIFADSSPAANAEELTAAVRDGGLNLNAVADGMPDQLATLIYDATRGDPAARIKSIGEFRKRLGDVWEKVTAPEPEPVIDPLDAQTGDVLDGGLTVVRRLGKGATALALLVKPTDSDREVVLKVALDESHAERLADEAAAIRKLPSWQVAALVGDRNPVTVGPRTALLLESAGDRTLAEELQTGRLALGLLERYGRDLLEIVALLDGQGMWHRDLKPANLAARPRPKDSELHLCLFDFSLANVPATQLGAGTVPYLDPFLGPPRRQRYDAAAERFAAAVTLYEMATGTHPRWGDNANPAAVSVEVTLDPRAFDPAIADRLVAYFAKALARDTESRFDTAEEMLDAWRAIFRAIPTVTQRDDDAVPLPGQIARDSPLDALDLTARARSAIERLGPHTVGELLDYDSVALNRAKGVPDATRKEIAAQLRFLRQLFAEPDDREPADEDQPLAHGVEAVCRTLLPDGLKAAERTAMQLLLGQVADPNGKHLHWPTQSDTAEGQSGFSQPQVSQWLRKHAKLWLTINPSLEQVRNEIVSLLDARGAVMSAEELGEALITARGAYTSEPARSAMAIGLVRAAIEAELVRGGDARVAMHRLRTGTVLIGREPDDPDAETTADDLLGYAVELGKRATGLVKLEPLPTRQRAIDELRLIVATETMPALGDQRLLQLAAAASGTAAAVNAQGQLYPVGMAPEHSLRLAAGTLIGQTLEPVAVQARIKSRFPRAADLPGRPELDELLKAARVPLKWNEELRRYVPPTRATGSATMKPTSMAPIVGAVEASEVQTKLADVIDRRGFLAIVVPPTSIGPDGVRVNAIRAARTALLGRFGLTEVDVTGIMLETLRGLDFPWQAIVDADNGVPGNADFRVLTDLFAHECVPAIVKTLDDLDGPALITEAAPLARYGQMQVLRELTDPTRPRRAARLLLVPGRRIDPVMLDSDQVPLTSPAHQRLLLPTSWITPTISIAKGSR